MQHTRIEWVKNPDGTQGYTWNPITGCLNHVSGLCKGGGFPCYAYKLANGRLKQRYLANKNYCTATPKGYDGYPNLDPFYPRFWPERLKDIVRGYHYQSFSWAESEFAAKARGVFVCDMGELFGDWIPREWQDQIFKTINRYANKDDRFYLLTKQPQNLPKFSPFPENCWVGVTATEQHYFVRATAELRFIEAKIKYLSFEPLLCHIPMLPEALTLAGINWVIIGAQTKPTVMPKIEWVEEIVQACDKAGVKVFLKDNLKPLIPPFGNELFPPAIRVRQEIPE